MLAARDTTPAPRASVACTTARLLDATIDSLVEDGYAATTLRAVISRAGVSRGAATHHFPRRLDLIVAALERLTERRMRELRAAVAALPGGGVQRRRAAVDLVRSAYGGPLFVAWVRLWVAAGEDAALRERIRPLERRVRQLMRELAADAMPDLAAAPGFGARLAVMATTLNGLGLWAHFEPRSTDHRGDPWPAHRAVIELILTAPAESLDIKHETSA